MDEKKFEEAEEIKETSTDTEESADEQINLDEVEFDPEAIEEVKKFERSVDLFTKKMIIGSAAAFGIVIVTVILLAILL